jgi:hypothetical protein
MVQRFCSVNIVDPGSCRELHLTIFRVIGGFLNAATNSLKRVSERIFRISKCHIVQEKRNSSIFYSSGSK